VRNVSDKFFLERIQLTFELSFLEIWHFFTLFGKPSIARHCIDGNIMRRMRFKMSITKARDTHLDYVILIDFPWAELLQKLSPMLRL